MSEILMNRLRKKIGKNFRKGLANLDVNELRYLEKFYREEIWQDACANLIDEYLKKKKEIVTKELERRLNEG